MHRRTNSYDTALTHAPAHQFILCGAPIHAPEHQFMVYITNSCTGTPISGSVEPHFMLQSTNSCYTALTNAPAQQFMHCGAEIHAAEHQFMLCITNTHTHTHTPTHQFMLCGVPIHAPEHQFMLYNNNSCNSCSRTTIHAIQHPPTDLHYSIGSPSGVPILSRSRLQTKILFDASLPESS